MQLTYLIILQVINSKMKSVKFSLLIIGFGFWRSRTFSLMTTVTGTKGAIISFILNLNQDAYFPLNMMGTKHSEQIRLYLTPSYTKTMRIGPSSVNCCLCQNIDSDTFLILERFLEKNLILKS